MRTVTPPRDRHQQCCRPQTSDQVNYTGGKCPPAANAHRDTEHQPLKTTTPLPLAALLHLRPPILSLEKAEEAPKETSWQQTIPPGW